MLLLLKPASALKAFLIFIPLWPLEILYSFFADFSGVPHCASLFCDLFFYIGLCFLCIEFDSLMTSRFVNLLLVVMFACW